MSKRVIHIILDGAPLTVNHLYGQFGGRRFLTADGRARKEAYAWMVRSQFRGEPIETDVDVDITAYFPNKRRRDSDNILKTIFDSLNKIVLKDDSQITDHHVHMRYDKEKPRVEVVITEI